MCGIAGIVQWTESAAPWGTLARGLSALELMSEAIAHRGPDGAGRWLDPRSHRAVALLHRRLAIIDLPCGAQPMGNEDGKVQVVFNGEIYNHRELRKALLAAGHTFKTDHSDTEVLVHGWEEWGVDLVRQLRGMFALAIWDQRTDTLFMARDRMGQKPLFYSHVDGGIVFGSTINAVLSWPEVPRVVPRDRLVTYLHRGYLPPPATIYKDVAQLMPGHWLRLTRSKLDGGSFWPRVPAVKIPFPEYDAFSEHQLGPPIRDIRQHLARAVRSQMQADVPVVCFLSGGIDSSIIAALMQQAAREAGGEAIHTVSVGFASAAFDETPFAEAVAKHIGSKHQRLQANVDADVPDQLATLMRLALGQPFADSSLLPTHLLSKAVRQLAPVALSGDGGDELFGGYDRYRGLGVLKQFGSVLRRLPPLPIGKAKFRERLKRLSHASRGKDDLASYRRMMELYTQQQVADLWQELPVLPDETLPADITGCTSNPAKQMMLLDQRDYMPGDVLWKVDAASMACALEVRAPFLDHSMVELANSLPVEWQIHDHKGKWILRRAFRENLPEEVFTRGKQGFGVPIGEWFRLQLRAPLHDALTARGSLCRTRLNAKAVDRLLVEHDKQRADHTHRLFSLWMLEIWWKQAGAAVE